MSQAPQYHIRVGSGEQYGPRNLDTIVQWAREGRVPRDAQLVPTDGSPPINAVSLPRLAAVLAAPPTVGGDLGMPERDDAMSGLIPYRNGAALAGYYVSVGGLAAMLIPLVGLFVTVFAIILGVMGLKRVRANPKVKGTAHAWVAIILGSIETLVCGGLTVLVIVAMVSK